MSDAEWGADWGDPFHHPRPEIDELAETTSRLGRVYDEWKQAEKFKDEYREEFFRQVSEKLKEEVAPQIIAEFPTEDEEEALRMAQRQYVRHRVVSSAPMEGGYQVVLEEDAELRPFTFLNKEDGQVYQRIVSEGSPSLDDEALAEEQPELWEAITNEVTTRELKPLEELTPEQVAELQKYITMPKPQMRLGKPRRAKPEELDDDDS